jgi:phage-related protein (TIGR01555 family)
MEQDMRLDGYTNMLTKVGTSRDSTEAYVYKPETPTADVELAQIYTSNGLFAKIIDKPAELAFKNGYDLGIGDKDIQDKVEKELARIGWKDKGVTALKWARLFGGGAILMNVDDGRDLDEPIDMDAVTAVKKLIVFERPEITPDYTSIYTDAWDVDNENFGLPEYYMVMPVYGGQQVRVHASRLLIFRNGEMPRTSTMSTEYMFFGIPEYNRIRRELRNTITSHGNGNRLLERCVQAVCKIKDLASLLQTETGEEAVIRRMQLIDMARNLLNTMIIDAEGEDYSFQTFQLSGVKDIIDESCNLLSAVTNIPQTVLFGRSPAGENATGEGDLTNYYDYVGQIQSPGVVDNLRRLVEIILSAFVHEGKLDAVPEHNITPNPLWNMSDKENAELEQSKAQAELTKAQATQIYVDMQVLDPKEVRQQMAEGDVYHIEDVLSEDDLGLEDLLGELQSQDPETEPDPDADPDIGNDDLSTDSYDDADVKYGVGIIVVKGGKVLCARRKDNKRICGPGGHIEAGEDMETAAIREAGEEFAIIPENLRYIGDIEGDGEQYLPSHIFLCTIYEGQPICMNSEMEGAGWLSLGELSALNLFLPFKASLDLLENVLCGYHDDLHNDRWVTTKKGKHIEFGKNGEILKGNPAAVGRKSGSKKNEPQNGSGAEKPLQSSPEGGNIPSAKGSNVLQVKGFKDKQHLNNHWKNGRSHQKEYEKDGITTAAEYQKRAVQLAEMPVGNGIRGYKTKEGHICRYDEEKNDYVKADLKKGIRTMFKPVDGAAYFEGCKAIEGVDDDE